MRPSPNVSLISVDDASVLAAAGRAFAALSVPPARAGRKAYVLVFSDTAGLPFVVAA